jgi:Flp pilus assembly pilin Flp
MLSQRHRASQRRRPRGAIGRLALGLRTFIADERGQDVIEYGLLSALFGIVCIVIWVAIQDRLREVYVGYDTNVQDLWQSPPPGGS